MDQGLRWRVSTHTHQDRSVDWYWALGIIGVVGVGLSIYLGNILLAVIIGLSFTSIAVLSVRGPRDHDVWVHERGVTVDGTLYPYQSLHSFWVMIDEFIDEESGEHLEEPVGTLLLSTHNYLHPRLSLPLDSLEHAEAVRDYLAERLTEEEQEERFDERIAELLGF